jgi:ABC-type glycerol-3-phosphate transport system substrate-binding protein
VRIDGRVWALPQDMGPMVLFYREDLFDAQRPRRPRHLGEFRDTSARLRRAAPGSYLTAFPERDTFWFASLTAAAGAEWFGTEGGTTPTGPEGRWRVAPLPSADADRPSSGFVWKGSSTATCGRSPWAATAGSSRPWPRPS